MVQKRSSCICGYEGRDDNRRVHQKKCKIFLHVEGLKSEIEKMKLELFERSEEVRRRDSQIIDLLQQIKSNVVTTSNTTNTISHNNTVNITNNILTICPSFGSEPALKRGKVKRILEDTKFNCIDTLPEYIRQKYLNFDGYGNIRIVNKKGNKVEVIEEVDTGEKKWVERDRDDTIHDMTEENIEEMIEQYCPYLQVSGHFFDTYQKRLKRDNSEFKSLKNKVESMLTQKKN